MKDITIGELLVQAKSNTQSGSKNYYKPLPKDQSQMIREHFKSKIEIPLDGDLDTKFYNSEKTLIASGYTRVVIGDYGPYVEFSKYNIVMKNIKQKWAGSEKKHIKYVWMETKDGTKTKVYWQKNTVPYADYKVGMYYVHPAQLIVDDGEE